MVIQNKYCKIIFILQKHKSRLNRNQIFMKSKILITILSILIFIQCKKVDCVEKLDTNCACIEIYDPVCGCNDKTYSNSCYAECAGINDYSDGECQ